MTFKKIPFSPPDITELEINEVVDTLQSGWITTGPKTKLLEKKLADYLTTNRTVCMSSQTASAEMVLRILGIGEGDEVITTAYTYTATAAVINHVGAKIVLVDCQNNSFEMDYDALDKSITEKTKAVIPVEIAGIPCDYDRIFSIIERKKGLFRPNSNTVLGQHIQDSIGRVMVISDSAHALGSMYGDNAVGTIADFTNYSFHAVKNLTTAEGGAITWKSIQGVDDEAIYKQLQLYSLHGQSKDAFNKTQIGAWEYDVIGTWYKCNMTDIMASIGLAQLSRYPKMLDKRKRIVEKYDSELGPLGIKVLPHIADKYKSSYHLYMTRIPGISEKERNDIILKMSDYGIATNVHYKPLPMHSAYKSLGFDISDYKNAYENYKNEITLPLYSRLSDEDISYIIEKFKMIVSEYI